MLKPKQEKKRDDPTGRWRPWWRGWRAFKLDKKGVSKPHPGDDHAYYELWWPMDRVAWTYEVVRRLSKTISKGKPPNMTKRSWEEIQRLPAFPDLDRAQRRELLHTLSTRFKTRPLMLLGWHPQYEDGKYSDSMPPWRVDLEVGDQAFLNALQNWLRWQRKTHGIAIAGKGAKGERSRNSKPERKAVSWSQLDEFDAPPPPGGWYSADTRELGKRWNKLKSKFRELGLRDYKGVLLALSLATDQESGSPNYVPSTYGVNTSQPGFEIRFTLTELVSIFQECGFEHSGLPDAPEGVVNVNPFDPEFIEANFDSVVAQATALRDTGLSIDEMHLQQKQGFSHPKLREIYDRGAMVAVEVESLKDALRSSGKAFEMENAAISSVSYAEFIPMLAEIYQAGELSPVSASRILKRLCLLSDQRAAGLRKTEVHSIQSASGEST